MYHEKETDNPTNNRERLLTITRAEQPSKGDGFEPDCSHDNLSPEFNSNSQTINNLSSSLSFVRKDFQNNCNTDSGEYASENTAQSENPQIASLGTIAKLASTSQNNPRDEATIKRFKLQSLAQKLLPTKRVSSCLWWTVPGAHTVDIYHVPERESAHFHNLRTCDSVWDCPVCAAKITEQRRVELMLAVAHAYEVGYTPVLVTWTLRHHRGDKLRDLLNVLKESKRALKAGRAFQNLKADYGWVGSVSATEVTHGYRRVKNNGWHPHGHELVFLEPIAAGKLRGLESELRAMWEHQLTKRGYDATWERGVKVQDSDTAVIEYLAKWGHEPKGTRWTVERELTKAPTKMASDDGVTPFQLLEMYGAGDEEAGRLFREYSAAFHGRAQLRWSGGLRALLGLSEKEPTDAEIMAAADAGSQLLASMDKYTWYKLIRLPRDVRGELLCVARRGDVGALEAFISDAIGENVALRNSDAVDDIRENVTKQGGEPVTKFAGWADGLPSSSAACDVASAGESDAPVVGVPVGGLGLGTVGLSTGVKSDGCIAAGVRETQRGNDIPVDVPHWAAAAYRRFTAAGWKRVQRLGSADDAVQIVVGHSPPEIVREDGVDQ